MANVYYSPGAERAARVDALFSRIARRYDVINDAQSFCLHRVWKRRLVEIAQITPGVRVLDVCSGTGDLVFAMARRGAIVVGVDFCGPMLSVASKRARKSAANGPGGVFVQADAQRLPFADASFDVVTVSYGLRNLADLDLGLRELLRVLRSGGRLVSLDFGKPERTWWRSCYMAYLACALPVFGKLLAGDSQAYAYVLESLKHYPAQRGVEERLLRLGCRNTRIVNFLGGAMGMNIAEKGLS